jgi:ATP-dependent RNA helicase DDX10/DBP4
MTKKVQRGKNQESEQQRTEKEIDSLNARIAAETPARGSTPQSGVVAFASLPLSDATLRGLAKGNYTTMTAIQNAGIPHSLAGRDILGAAKTGSGKTLSFVVPILECLYRNRWSRNQDGPGAIVLSPTRELAGQIFQVLRQVGLYHKSLSVGLLMGGQKDFANEQQHVPQTNILIATPGRLLQHLEQTPYFDVDSLKMLVLDEADRILDMGFRDQLIRILDYLPKEKQTLLYSATQTKDVSHLATLSMNRNNLEYVGVHDKDSTDTPDALVQSYVVVPLQHKLNCVYSFLKSHLKCKTIIFFASCSQVRHGWELFCSLRPGLSVMALHGKLSQSKRTEVYDKFMQTPHAVLFATDIASRGLDFPDVDWVVQVDAPEDQDVYIHRVGRTARYKNKGNSLLILDPLEEPLTKKWTLKLPLKKKSINPTKTVLVTQRAASLAAGDVKLHQLAKKAFSSYVRSVALLPNSVDVKVQDMDLAEYAISLGLASMPNLRFLEKITSREGLRKAKNVNRKLQKLKDQIKAEKLAKKIARLQPGESNVGEASTSSKKRKVSSDDQEDDGDNDDEDDFLVVKARHVPEVESTDLTDNFNLNEVTQSRKSKKIRVGASTSHTNKHVVFDEDGEEQEDILVAVAAVAKKDGDDDNEQEQADLAEANAAYLQQVRQRLERNQLQDKEEEKQRIRDKHRKKRVQQKGEKQDAADDNAMVATLDSDDDHGAEQQEFGSNFNEDSDSSDSSSDGEDDDGEGLDVAAQEDLALSLIRGS